MCGIAGIIEADPGRPAARAELATMLGLLEHRGPDGEGTAETPGACLGHRRLAIIDLTEAGNQPFPSEDRSVWCVVNGEIYNHGDLRRDLESRGHRFRSRSDSEVAVHLYEEHGANAVAMLEGMFALAVWDAGRRCLLLARDRLGKKPLYTHETPGRIAFASEVAPLLALTGVPNTPDELAIHHYLTFRFVPSPFTGFRALRKIPPGHLLLWQSGRSTLKRYWSLPDPWSGEKERGSAGRDRWSGGQDQGRVASEAGDRGRGELAVKLRELLGAGVRRRLESDVPLGLLLSGGLDSSAIAVEMAAAMGNGFPTFSVGFSETDYDESPYAEQVARHVGSSHHAVQVTSEVASVLPRLVRRFGEPFADSSAVAVEALARAVRPHVKVVLGGDGGDELLGGYDRYRALALSSRVGRPVGALLSRIASLSASAIPSRARSRGGALAAGRRNALGRALRFAEALAAGPLERNEAWLACFTGAGKQALYSSQLAARMAEVESINLLRACYPASADPLARASAGPLAPASVDPVVVAMHADLAFSLPERMLFKLDIATMSVALEARCPFLDIPLVEWAAALPSGMKVSSRLGKPLLRLAYRDALPPGILNRKKAGFGLPVDRWLRGPLREMAGDLLSGQRLAARGLFEVGAVGALLEEHNSGRRNHDDRLWTLLCLELWHQTFVDERPKAASPSTGLVPRLVTSAEGAATVPEAARVPEESRVPEAAARVLERRQRD